MQNVLLIALFALAGIDADVKPLAGPAVEGELVEVSNDVVVVQTSEGRQTLDVAALWEISLPSDSGSFDLLPAVWVDLVDGSQLRVRRYVVAKDLATIDLATGEQVTIPTRSIHSVRLRDHSGNSEIAQQWQEIVSERSVGDVIVIRRRESLDQLEGVLHDISEEIVQFEFDGDRIDVNRKKLDGFLYYHPTARTLPERICQLVDASGSRWNVKSLRMVEQRIELVTVAGSEAVLPIRQLSKIDFSSGNSRWLGELKPESVQWRPFVNSLLPENRLAQLFYPRTDIGFTHEALSLDGIEYPRGLAIRSRTQLVYRLTEEYRQFHAQVGIDDHVRYGGDVDLVISGDGKVLFSEKITGRDRSFPVDLDITGVRRLEILVDFGEESDIADHLNLCDARITK